MAASGDVRYARGFGRIAGVEGRAVGVNYAFAPIIDIDYNTLNPITNTRPFGFDYPVHFPDESETTRAFIEKYDAPWFVNDIPTIAVSFADPYHLRDIPQIKTYINAYTTSAYTVEAVADKLLGRSEFTGRNPVDATCGYYELNM